MTPALSIALCTRNGARRLPGVLHDLEREGASLGSGWELVVVDNGSSDATAEVALGWRERLPLRLVSEPIAGLARARNRAMDVAAAAVVVFIDDDVRLEPTWLAAWCAELAMHQEVAWFGGSIEPSWVDGRPGWVRDDRLDLLAGVYGLYRAPRPSGPYRLGGPLPLGAHFAIRRPAYERVGPFRTDLGLQGDRRGLGEETEWFQRALALGEPGRCVGAACVLHPVPRSRLRLGALLRHGIVSGEAYARIHPDAAPGSHWRAIANVFRGTVQWLRGNGDRFRQCVVNAGAEIGLRRQQRASRGNP